MKKTKYLVAALLLMGATTTFTSCIDNDEPAGITELRGAKAELLKAKAVVEQARAQKILAEAEYQKALAATEQANAKYREAEAKWMEAKAEFEAAQTEEEKARVEASIAYYKNLMEEQAILHETAMVNYQKQLAEAKRQYDLVIKQIEIAEAIMSDKDKVSVGFLKNEVNKAYAIIYGGKYYESYDMQTGAGTNEVTYADQPSSGEKQTLNGKLFDANENLYDAMLDKTHGFVDPENDGNAVFIAKLEYDVEVQKANVEANQNKVNKLENFLDEDVETADWRAEIAELEDSIKTLKVERDQLEIKVEEAEASPEYLKAAQAYKGIAGDGKLGDPTDTNIDKINAYKQKGTAQELTLAKSELNKAFADKEISIKEFEVETSQTVKDLVKPNISTVANRNDLFVVSETGDIKDQFVVTDNTGDVDYKASATLKSNLDKISEWIKAAEKTNSDANDEALAELTLEKKQKAEKAAKESYETSVNNKLDKAVDAYNGKVEQADIDATKTDLKKVVDAYTTAHKALVAAVNTYNTTYKSVYDAGYKAGEETFKTNTRLNLFKGENSIDNSLVVNTLNSIKSDLGTTYSSQSSVLKTEANALALIADAFNGSTADVIKKNQSILTDAVNEAIAVYFVKAEGKDALETAAKTAANDAVSESKNDPKGEIKLAADAMTKADNAAIKAFGEIASAKSKWLAGDVNTILAQIEDTKNVKSLKDITGIDGTPASLVSDNKDKPEVKEVKSSDITTEEFASYTVTKLGDETLVKSVVRNAAEYVYGNWGFGADDYKIVAPSAQEMRDKFGDNLGDVIDADNGKYVGGTYGAWIAAQDALKDCEEAIAATEDLKALVEDLTKLKADYEAAIEEAKSTAYGKEIKTYEDAIVSNEKAKAAFEAEEVKVEEISLEVAKIGIKISALEDVRIDLITAVNNHLGLENPSTYDPDKFEDALKLALQQAKSNLADAQQSLAKAEKALEDAKNGEYDKVAHCQRIVDELMAQIAIAQKNYDAALANLETALEIMAKTAE